MTDRAKLSWIHERALEATFALKRGSSKTANEARVGEEKKMTREGTGQSFPEQVSQEEDWLVVKECFVKDGSRWVGCHSERDQG